MRSTVGRLQAALNRYNANLVVDGDCGSLTIQAFDNLSAHDQVMLDFELTMEIGMGARKAMVGGGFSVPGYNYLTKDDCDRFVVKACKLLQMERYAPVFKEFLRLEAGKKVIGGKTCYNVLSTNGGARGLMQFYEPAWKDARAKALSVNPELDIGPYIDYVYFPVNNIIAGIAYSLVSIDLMENTYGVPINGETLYLSHNQGPHFWKRENLRGQNIDGQSREARQLIRKYQELLS